MASQPSMNEVFINCLNTIIEDHIEDEQFGVEELAIGLGISRSQLHRKLNAINGKSTSQFIREFRLEKAMEMLRDDVATASEISYRVGFGSPTYFNTSFHQYYGYPPGEVKFRTTSNDENHLDIQPSNFDSETVIRKKKFFNLRTYGIGALALIFIIIFAYYNSNKRETSKTVENINRICIDNSIAVLPFKNMSGDAKNEAFCDGMTVAVISRLSKIKGISKVISQTSMMGYKDNQKTMPEIADELKVHYVLESGFQKSGNNIKINLQLIEAASDKLYWSEEYEGTYDSIFKIQAKVAEMVAKQLDADITAEEQKDIMQTMTNNIEAYENYLQGKRIFSADNATKSLPASRRYFEKAIALDSTFVEAYVQLGWSYSLMGTWLGKMDKRSADSLAAPYFNKALHFDPNNLDLYEAMANKEFFNWNFKVADSMYNVIWHQQGDGFMTTFRDLMFGRYDEAVKGGTNCLKKYPIRASFFPLTYGYYHKGDIDSTLYMIHTILLKNPNSEPGCDHMGNLLLALKDYERARDVLETGLQISNKRHASMVVHLSLVYHYLGDEKKSLELINEVIDRAKKGEPEINVFVAHYYARLGNKDEAFKWLDIAYKKHEVDLIWLKADPNLALLKNDRRYKELIKKMGFL